MAGRPADPVRERPNHPVRRSATNGDGRTPGHTPADHGAETPCPQEAPRAVPRVQRRTRTRFTCPKSHGAARGHPTDRHVTPRYGGERTDPKPSGTPIRRGSAHLAPTASRSRDHRFPRRRARSRPPCHGVGRTTRPTGPSARVASSPAPNRHGGDRIIAGKGYAGGARPRTEAAHRVHAEGARHGHPPVDSLRSTPSTDRSRMHRERFLERR